MSLHALRYVGCYSCALDVGQARLRPEMRMVVLVALSRYMLAAAAATRPLRISFATM